MNVEPPERSMQCANEEAQNLQTEPEMTNHEAFCEAQHSTGPFTASSPATWSA